MADEQVLVTSEAQEQVLRALKSQEGKEALRLEALVGGGMDFTYAMKLVPGSDRNAEDHIIELEGFSLFVDPRSAENLKGATVDYEEGILRSGFKFENPNKPEIPELGSGPRPDLVGETAEKVEHLINTEINNAVAAHGGRVEFVGVRDDKVYLSFGGGCHGCGMVDVTLKQGIESRIKELVPEIIAVVDVTDHSTGENPFYR